MAEDHKAAAQAMLEALDVFMSGRAQAEADRELYSSVILAGCFAAQAYEKAPGGGPDVHALIRSFLLALIDASDERLDYLRAEPASGAAARDADDRLRELFKPSGGSA